MALYKYNTRSFRLIGCCIIAMILVRVIWVYVSPYQYYFTPTLDADSSKQDDADDEQHTFSPYTYGGVYSLRDVCIEEDLSEPPVLVAVNKSTTFKRIVVYNSPYDGAVELKVAASPTANVHSWPLVLKKQPVPATHNYITDYAVYFVISTCTGNLHHFWEDVIMGLHGSIAATNRLHSEVRNQVYYRKPDIPTYAPNCFDLHR